MKHKHRIKPGYEGGKYKEGNVIVLSPTQHAMWHFAEWRRKGNLADFLAWKSLSKTAPFSEIISQMLSLAGKKGGQWTKDPERKAELRKIRKGMRHGSEARAKIRKAHETRTGQGEHLKTLPKETRRKNASAGSLGRWGWKGFFPASKDFRTSLSETFVDYYILYGRP